MGERKSGAQGHILAALSADFSPYHSYLCTHVSSSPTNDLSTRADNQPRFVAFASLLLSAK